MRTTKRLLQVLQLFTMENPEWSIQDAARKLDLSQSTAYVYFRDLVDAALLVKSRTGYYNIGPAVIVYDRLTRQSDPIISLSRPLMKGLVAFAGMECVALVCRLYRMTVLCVAQEVTARADFGVSYERGRPMSLFRGAASKVILAHIERRKLRRYYDEFSDELSKADMGRTWNEFKASLRRIRATPFYVTLGEVDPGRAGISAPIFSPEGEILGSLSLVVTENKLRRSEGLLEKLGQRLHNASRELTESLANFDAAAPIVSPSKASSVRRGRAKRSTSKSRGKRS